jgi:uncharacterized protein YprB with RNaseH-like and TPR domain
MAKVNIARLKKDEIVFLYNQRCKHGHRYLEHYGCYLDEKPDKIRVGFFDIEASNLKADFGIILSYSILSNKGVYYGDVITEADLHGSLDKRIVSQMVKDIRNFDVIVGFYSTKYDIPFARTRAHVLGLGFPVYGEVQHKDVYYMVKYKFSLSRSSQENAARMLVGKTEKTRMKPELWVRALGGDKKSLDYIFDHNKRDVRDLKRLYEEVIAYVKNSTKSI